ncbi:TniQ family protein [Microbulbifer sp.]|uniref:TniQ family protein n=1 Tax=Microbulbifer sp. TaxID=1908541 RepID=UPI002586FE88|nr:TniQ family protein [Microbulbifer sp.]
MRNLNFVDFIITPCILSSHSDIEGESNVSIIARAIWRYRFMPAAFVSKIVLQNARTHGMSLESDIAAFCNSVTDKSVAVTNRLRDITGLDIDGLSSYTYLRGVLDKGAHGLISNHKKWCAECYRESIGNYAQEKEAKVADELYWSLSLSRYCAKHLCTLSECCGTCYQRQPYISNRFEPGYCHHCGSSLAAAPSVIPGGDDHSALDALNSLSKMDIFLPEQAGRKGYSLDILARNLRGLVQTCGANGEQIVAECFGVGESTLRDWCARKHGVSLESLVKIIEGLQLPKMSILFSELDTFLESVGTQLTKQFNFNVKKSAAVLLPEISLFMRDIIDGKRKPIARESIAKQFGVSKGMLENAFHRELCQISELYERERKKLRDQARSTLQYHMNRAVQRCGSKMRPFDWPHIFAEFKEIDVRNVSQRELDEARDAAIKKYTESERRDSSRDISQLIPKE